MILNAHDHDVALNRTSTIVVVGAGPAAFVLATELAGLAQVLIIEAGGLESDAQHAWLLSGESDGQTYPIEAVRARQLGGTSALWAGYCAEFDAEDFVSRAAIPLSGWPLGQQELGSYRERVADVLGLKSDRAVRPATAFVESTVAFDHRALRVSRWLFAPTPRRFANEFLRFGSYDDPTILFNAEVVELTLSRDHTRVEELVVRTSNGRHGRIRGNSFVLASGGIETPRLLLSSNNQIPFGLGNSSDMVGRCLMEHPHRPIESLELRHAEILEESATQQSLGECRYMLNFGLPSAVQAELGVLNARAHAYRTTMMSDAVPPRLGLMLEQAPNPASRLMLSEKTDAVGMRKVRINWQLTSLDHQSFTATAHMIASEFQRAGLGLILGDEDPHASVGYCCYQLGTTRMSIDPREGVTDKHCRVHDLENLYIAGGSVFPTASWANPTVTVLAIAYRLADRLRTLLLGTDASRRGTPHSPATPAFH